jgi:hypothetical protein
VRGSQISSPAQDGARNDRGADPEDVRPGSLSGPERMSLRRLITGTAAVSIPIGHLARFRHLGLTRPTAVGESVTDKGKAEARKRPR